MTEAIFHLLTADALRDAIARAKRKSTKVRCVSLDLKLYLVQSSSDSAAWYRVKLAQAGGIKMAECSCLGAQKAVCIHMVKAVSYHIALVSKQRRAAQQKVA